MTKKEKEIRKLKLALIGRPGSGKGTQVELLRQKFGLILIPSPGDIYRDPKFRRTKWGKIVSPLVNQGKFAPNEITNQLMKEKIFSLTKGKRGFISEGYPRTLSQAKFADQEIGLDYLINLKVPAKVIIERLSGRRICPKCKTIYHLVTMPPKKDNICDHCQTPLIQREDDKPESIKNRLKIYYRTAKPTIEYYRRKGKLIEVNGNQSIKKVFKEIVHALLKNYDSN
ncbi:MAG: adenylate kinase family protein [Patescibacteria group bacterium]